MSVLLLDVGASAPALPNLVPVAQVYGRWAPAVYQFPAVPVPGAFAATALADAVLLSWTAVSRATYVIERAPDVSGSAGTWVEIERTGALAVGFPVPAGTAYWWRVRAVVFGRSSDRTTAIKRAPTNMASALADLSSNLATVSGVASAAQAAASSALGKLSDIANDNLLTTNEKPSVIRDYDIMVAEQSGIDAQATAYSITTEKTAYDSAISALTSYLGGLTTPTAWNNLAGDTTIVGATFRAKFADVYTARQTLLNKIYAQAKAKADAAQSTANSAQSAAGAAQSAANAAQSDATSALGKLTDIASDSLLTPDEKPRVIQDRDLILAEQSGIDAQATAYSITTEKTAYDSAISALTSYLATLTSPVLWSNLGGNTTIVGATFRSKFADVYTARQTLLNKIYAQAKAKADAAQSTANSAQSAAATAQSAADAAQSAASSALGKLADIANDNLLTPDEKPSVVRDYTIITAEQAGIDSEANDYRIVAEKAAYDAAVSALTAYLGTLTTPTAWNNLGGNTTIVGATFRAMFADVYTTRQALLNAITAVIRGRVAAAQGPNLAVNYRFYDGIGLWARADGTTSAVIANELSDGFLRATAGSGYSGASNFNLYEFHWFEVQSGDVFFVAANVSAYYSSNACGFGLYFEDGAGSPTWISIGTVAAGIGSTALSGTITAPAGSVRGRLWAKINTATSSDRIGFSRVYCERSLLLKPGSGAQLGDARNQAMVTVGNFGSAWSGLSVTWTTTTTSATLTASAATLQVGSAAISYNSASVTVSGSAGSTISFYLYYDDPAYAGGAKTLNASTTYINSINSNGRVYVGQANVAFPTSGTGGGGGGQRPCVQIEMLVIERGRGVIRAGDVRVNDWLLRGDGSYGRVAFAEQRSTQGVRMLAGDGAWLDCSVAAPIQSGTGFRLAPDMPGHMTPRWWTGANGLAPATDVLVTSAADLGEIAVQHITLDPGDSPREHARVFLASADGRSWWGHHNAKMPDPFEP